LLDRVSTVANGSSYPHFYFFSSLGSKWLQSTRTLTATDQQQPDRVRRSGLMTIEKKKQYDKTSSKRQAGHLARMMKNKGKRLPVDFDADRLDKLDALIGAGYGDSKAAVIRKSIDDAYKEVLDKH